MSIVLEDIAKWAKDNKPKKTKGKSEHDAASGFGTKKKPKTQIEKDIEEWAKGK